MEFIDLKQQYQNIKPQVLKRIENVLDHGKYIMGPEVNELEGALSRFCDVTHAVTCSSGTDALLMILMAMDIGPNDAVFVPAFTFPATPEVVALLGAHPVFVDVDKETCNISPSALEDSILKTKAEGLNPKLIMAVDLYGLPADYDALALIAEKYDIKLISDAAQSFGGVYKGKKVGQVAIATATSFFPAKPLGCYGDGGAVLTDSDELAKKLKSIRVHGKGRNKYENIRVGLNARMDTIQAAVLIEKLKIFPREIELRNKVAKKYSARLTNVTKVPEVPLDSLSVWAQYTVHLQSEHERSHVQDVLSESHIPSVVYYPEILPNQKAYIKYVLPKQRFENSIHLAKTVLSLPMHPYLSDNDINHICKVLQGVLIEEFSQ